MSLLGQVDITPLLSLKGFTENIYLLSPIYVLGNISKYCKWCPYVSSGHYGSVIIGITLALLSKKKLRQQSYLLIIRHEEEAADELRDHLRKLNTTLKSKNVRKGYAELTLELILRDDNTSFMQKLASISGVVECSLVNYSGDYAQ
ncbi:hypothetical protein NCCP2222_36020 [Sporosarcina sp. NCCP-2222]|uniref:hypothetical protein n=1 Tax=Sporosarcina sp. NCCP-2222 TaxID=2935073 RepID=UPI002085589E|nr:hypothetical protein [Sporosarcina sp. NCCP-2222]GKV57655.1 hypothetical protein NCCP2222_36020 [Sporosarcina sp. NCCP-2222]